MDGNEEYPNIMGITIRPSEKEKKSKSIYLIQYRNYLFREVTEAGL